MADTPEIVSSVRYEANEKTPVPLTAGLGLQLAILCVAGIVLTPAIVIRAAGGSEEYLIWAVFGAVVVSGITTVLQALGLARIGAGYVLLMGTSGAFIAVSITAIAEGGPAMLATLIVCSAICQYALAARLSFFRRVLTPAVAGTVIMLIPVSVAPIIFDMLEQVPEGASTYAAPVSALVTMVVIGAIALTMKGVLRLWAPVIGVIVGSVTSAFYGLYDVQEINAAAWFGIPSGGWPGFDLSFGPVFWALLPAFIFVTLIGAIETIGDSVAIQRVSWRKPRAIDYRAVQGAVAADGTGNLLSGLIGTLPNTTYSTSISVTELTGVANRNIGIAIGVIFIVLAFFPKALAVILAIPGPVACAYVMILLAMLFVVGMRIVVGDGLDYRKSLVVGISFWLGVGCQNGAIFPEILASFAGGLLQNGMTTGGLVAIVLVLVVRLTAPKSSKMATTFQIDSLPEIREFLTTFTKSHGWDPTMNQRLEAVSEETLLSLLESSKNSTDEPRNLHLSANKMQDEAVLEFIAAPGEANIQDRIALLGEQTSDAPAGSDFSLKVLRHLASSVRHQTYYDTDIITVHVKAPTAS